MTEPVVGALLERGFARMAGGLDGDAVATLRAAADRLFASQPAEPWSNAADWFAQAAWRPAHFCGPGEHTNLYDCLGLDERLDDAIESFVAAPRIRAIRETVLGPDHRLWYAQYRRAEPGAPTYRLHQDVYGELAFCVYLTPHATRAGSMVFWPGSHRWPRVLDRLPHLDPAVVAPYLASVEGDTGDCCLFFNKTWHGRAAAVDEPRLVFLISFIPSGPIEKKRRLPAAVRERLGPELQRVTAPDAALTFGDTPPTSPPLSCSFEEWPQGEADPTSAAHRAFAVAMRAAVRDMAPEVGALTENMLRDAGLA